jgi:hypothetical protein
MRGEPTKILSKNLEGKYFRYPDAVERIVLRWGLKKCVDWIRLTQDRMQWGLL